jgi:hypothetical protein
MSQQSSRVLSFIDINLFVDVFRMIRIPVICLSSEQTMGLCARQNRALLNPPHRSVLSWSFCFIVGRILVSLLHKCSSLLQPLSPRSRPSSITSSSSATNALKSLQHHHRVAPDDLYPVISIPALSHDGPISQHIQPFPVALSQTRPSLPPHRREQYLGTPCTR